MLFRSLWKSMEGFVSRQHLGRPLERGYLCLVAEEASRCSWKWSLGLGPRGRGISTSGGVAKVGPILTWGFSPDFVLPHCVARGAFVPQPAMEAVPPAVEARS